MSKNKEHKTNPELVVKQTGSFRHLKEQSTKGGKSAFFNPNEEEAIAADVKKAQREEWLENPTPNVVTATFRYK